MPTDLRKPAPIKRGSFYYDSVSDKKLIAVTTVLDMVAKPALVGWAAKQVAQYTFDNPGASFGEASTAHNRQSERAANKGKLIHSYAEAINQGAKPDTMKLPEDAAGWGEAFLAFRKQMPLKTIHAEVCCFNATYEYGGTCDEIAEMADKTLCLVDYKTGKGVYEWEHSLQLSAYRNAEYLVDPTTKEKLKFDPAKITKAIVIHLKGDGSWGMYEMPERFTAFLSYLHLFRAEKGHECPGSCYCKLF